MAQSSDVVIVGGGAAGCAAAYYLAKSGIKATIIEREGIASKASGMSAGGLNPLQGAGIPGPLAPLAMESFQMHMGLSKTLVEESGVDFQPHMIAMVRLVFEDSDVPELDETLDIFEAADGFSSRWLDAKELQELEPLVSQEAERALYTYGNAALNSHSYTLALSKAAEQLGATVQSASVTGLKTDGDRVTAVVTDAGEVACDAVVLATGPWSGEVEKWLNIRIPVEPLKGEIVRIELGDGRELSHDFSWAHASLFHRGDGLVWLGTTEESRGFDLETTEAARESLMSGAVKIMPSIADATIVTQTACLRPVTPDWLPIIGKAPGWDNAYLATGAGKKGILISPGIGKAVADMISDGKTDLPIGAFAPGRFVETSA